MPKRNEVLVGAPCWIDLMTSDVAHAKEFYNQVFGWEAREPAQEFGGYFTFTMNGDAVAGCMPAMQDNPMPDAWTTYLTSLNARSTIQAVEAHGGSVMVPAMDVGDLGTMGVVADPSGAVIGVWEPKAMKGIDLYAETGAPGWFNLDTRDYDRTVAFYRDAFAWTTSVMSDTSEFRYTTLKINGEELAGIMDSSTFLAEGEPSHWTVVFNVDDTDKAVEQVTGMGGSVVRPSMDSQWGRMATLKDPTGASFSVVTSV